MTDIEGLFLIFSATVHGLSLALIRYGGASGVLLAALTGISGIACAGLALAPIFAKLA